MLLLVRSDTAYVYFLLHEFVTTIHLQVLPILLNLLGSKSVSHNVVSDVLQELWQNMADYTSPKFACVVWTILLVGSDKIFQLDGFFTLIPFSFMFWFSPNICLFFSETN